MNLLLAILLFTVLSGAIRKWLVSASAVSNAILFVQLLTPFAFAAFVRIPPESSGRRFHPVLIMLTVLLVILAANPINQTVFHGIFGVIIHLGFWLMIFIYLEHRAEFPLEKLTTAVLILTVVEFVLSYFQYLLPAGHFLNKYANEEAVYAIAKVGNLIRTTGTFSYLSGFGSFVTFIAFVTWGQGVRSQNGWYRWLFLGMGVLMSLFSGARAIILIMVVFSIFSLLPYLHFQALAPMLVRSVIILFIAAYGLFQLPLFKLGISNMQKRITENVEEGETRTRIVGTVAEIIDFRGQFPLLGVGLGATYQGSNAIWGESYYLKNYGYYEEEGERIILEGGYVLYLVRVLLFSLMFSRLYGPWPYKLLLFALMLLYTNMVFNTYNTIFFFFGLAYIDRCYFLNVSSGNDQVPNENHRLTS
ncbi:MAG: hypothetical protein SFV52_02885 [Saprospiraceae bacterium]|nr:hypothetical protein [Saprospiraceae bacterium]